MNASVLDDEVALYVCVCECVGSYFNSGMHGCVATLAQNSTYSFLIMIKIAKSLVEGTRGRRKGINKAEWELYEEKGLPGGQ